MTARLVLAVSIISGRVDPKVTSDVIHSAQDADVLAAWAEQNRDDEGAAA